MRIRKTLAALAVVTSTMVGVGVASVGTASASDSGSDSATSNNGAWYQVYANGPTVGWHVNAGRTDERFYLTAGDTCGHTYSWNWNDVADAGTNNAWWQFACNLSWANLYPTNNGSQSGRTVSR
ncbi:hypothetical protein ACFV84_16965 [Kitasatospora sp. NPDC059811]|uniref:hypothetical protein n=1 Tax=Streptomycetaceae TaxID=2062 RepID=UPI0007AF0E3A|nr:hypothetical protein [Streptomyces sp. MJM8645]